MKKKGRKKTEGNVILFPDLEKRLLDRGLEQLQRKNYSQAIKLFEDAISLAPEDADVYVGLVLAYYEAGKLQKAKELASIMLKKALGEYFQTVDLYLMILVQLHEHEEIIATIEALQDEKEIPLDKQEHFSKLLSFSKRMVENKDHNVDVEENTNQQITEPLNLLGNGDPNKQLLIIAELTHKNIRSYIEEVKEYLQKKDEHPFLKTMLLNILKEQEYEKEIKIEKFGWEKVVNPVEIFSLQENNQFEEIKEVLSRVENKDPVLFQQIISLLERHFFLIYPFEFEPNNPEIWACAYNMAGLHFIGVETTLYKMAELYEVNEEQLDRAWGFIKKLEEISYPII